ncbi:MAG: choice-of-anchor J domain-containing protein [Bacteroidales bacterium]|jgi:hypothetical protein|nr:choice-of-anchor J domain-containing protein [Bacteroidales bacterium]
MKKLVSLISIVFITIGLNAQQENGAIAVKQPSNNKTLPKAVTNRYLNPQQQPVQSTFLAKSASYVIENFEGETFPPAGWTIVDQDADGYNWVINTESTISAMLSSFGVANSKCAVSASYLNTGQLGSPGATLTPNNFLITPQISVTTEIVFSFWIRTTPYDETYSVKVSTTDANPASFTNILSESEIQYESWTEKTVDLSAYAGQDIYIAFVHEGTDGFWLGIDNVAVYDPAGCTSIFSDETAIVQGNDLVINWDIDNAPDSYEIIVNGATIETALAGIVTSYTYQNCPDGLFDIEIIAKFDGCPSVSTTIEDIEKGTPCQWSITMYDALEDGWEGTVAVFQNNVVTTLLYTSTGTEAAPETLTFDVYIGTVTFAFLDGSYWGYIPYGEEVFTIYDQNGIDIYTTPLNGAGYSNLTTGYLLQDYAATCAELATNDATVTAITAPVSGTNLTATESVTVNIRNFGSDPITTMQLGLTVDGGTETVEDFTGNIASLAIQSYTFQATANLSAAGNHTITVRVILSGDENTENDSTTITVTNTVCEASTLPFTENFDASTSIPLCWTAIDANNDGYNWMIRESADDPNLPMYDAHSGSFFAASQSWVSSGGITPDNYLITPPLIIPAAGAILTYWVGDTYNEDGASEHYSVMISTTGTAAANFTAILTEDLTTTDWTLKTIDLAAYAGQNIYIAWRHHDCYDAELLKIDDIDVSPKSGIEAATINNVNIYPNPSKGDVNITVSEKSNIKVYDITGKVIDTFALNAYTQRTINKVSGMYFIQVESNGKTSIHKIVIN